MKKAWQYPHPPFLCKSKQADVLVLDEISATLEFLLGSKLANKDGLRPLLLTEFCNRVKSARLVLIADADLSEEALQYIEAIRGERTYSPTKLR